MLSYSPYVFSKVLGKNIRNQDGFSIFKKIQKSSWPPLKINLQKTKLVTKKFFNAETLTLNKVVKGEIQINDPSKHAPTTKSSIHTTASTEVSITGTLFSKNI
jgi:hypothetical protein